MVSRLVDTVSELSGSRVRTVRIRCLNIQFSVFGGATHVGRPAAAVTRFVDFRHSCLSVSFRVPVEVTHIAPLGGLLRGYGGVEPRLWYR